MNVRTKLAHMFNAGYAGTYLSSYEEQRVLAELMAVCKDIGFDLYVWTVTDSLIGPMGKKDKDDKPIPPNTFMSTVDPSQPLGPIELLEMMIPKDGKLVLPEKAVILAKDFHLFVEDRNPVLIRKVKDALSVGRWTNRRLVVLGCQYKLCAELEKEFTPVEFSLPDREALKMVMLGIAKSAGQQLNGATEPLVDAASGMTTTEAEDAAALSVIESEKHELDPKIIAREKNNVVKKNGLLEILESKETMSDMGGNDGAKEWVGKRKKAFTKEARAFGLPYPRALLLVGIPGCGKTFFGKIISNVLEAPLLKLDAGKLFGSLVGQSESNLRSVIATVEAVAPCVLLVDEIEKGLAGSKSSGQTDGGTSARVFGTFLQWMNDKTSPVFVVATANDVTQLPPEFLRKGRFDELFFVDLPDKDERQDIFRIHIGKRQRKPEDFDIESLSEQTQGFTGAEIEAVVVEALFTAFDKGRELCTQDISEAIAGTVPLSRTMAAQVEALRQWANGRARKASGPKVTLEQRTTRKLNAA